MTRTNAQQKRQNNIIIAVVGAAVVAAIALVVINFLGLGSGGVTVDYASIPVTRSEDGAFVAGNPDAPFTLVAFEDYRCHACLSYEPTLKQYLKDYVETGRAKFEFRMLQTASPDDTMFRLAQCAGEQIPARFFEFRDIMFDMSSRGWNPGSSPRDFATRAGLNYSDLLACTPDVAQVRTDAALATAVNVSGTPFMLYRDASGNLSPLPLGQAPNYDQLKAFVDPQIQ